MKTNLWDETVSEEWRTVVKAPKYEVSSFGRVRSVATGKILKLAIDRYGYPKIALMTDSRPYYATVHRLVAIAFLPNPENKAQVNHIDGDKTNNHYQNLEWTTPSENAIHATENYLWKTAWPVILIDHFSGKKQSFRSVKSLARFIGMSINILITRIKNSKKYKIFERYEIVVDKEYIAKSMNVISFGMKIFVYDFYTKHLTEYESLNVAAYHTGIRSMHRNWSENDIAYIAGFAVSTNRELILKNKNTVSSEEALQIRDNYYATPYNPRMVKTYIVYDYFSGKETRHATMSDLKNYINENRNKDTPPITTGNIHTALYVSVCQNRTALLRGFGLVAVTSDTEVNWTTWSEEMVLCNYHARLYQAAVYRVTEPDKEYLVFGFSAIKTMFPKITRMTKSSDLTEACGVPHVRITRLNVPMKVKIKI